MTLNRYFIHAGLALLTSLFSCDQKKQSDTPETDTLKAPKWINKVGVEQNEFKEEVFYVNDYDAIADGSALTTTAIQKAIDAAAATGGGTVSFKPGNYLSGSIFIKENVHFTIPEGVELLGSEDIADYTEIDTRIAGVEMPWPAALINVLDQKNVTIDGDGLVDGQGKVFWDYYWNLRKEYEPKGLRWIVDYDAKRPRTLLIQNSENIILEDLNIQRAGFWTVQVLYSNHVTVDGLTIRNNIGGHGPSTDGIDIDSSKYILVQNCNIDCNDDNFCLKAGRDWDGLRVNRSTEYVVIRDCVALAGSGLFTIGSETSGSIRHVYVSNIKGLGTKNGLNIKSATNRGGTVEDVYMQNIQMDSVRTFMEVSMNWNPSYSYSKLPEGYDYDSIPQRWKTMLMEVDPPEKGIPTFKDITLYNIDVKGAQRAINVNGMEQSLVENITLKDVHIQAAEAGQITHSTNWNIENVSLDINNGSTLKIENSPGVTFSDSLYVTYPKSN
ncbi:MULTISPECIES: glycoside hydrolase family 28 protein [unclassified Leeuwenhoekiella]|mgnify:CR=1 FL=1|uniref:glycoside hydrolase family 28 protein n=1 Tax=unclassified Leeuwenhoekiella TaxID=2615029 RepID=UPI000C61BF9D|nr:MULTISPECIES: glycoside hydrolase family 28 protein [unclassified Leeuwenhoekiella]MAW97067.1 exo-poly-alpha-D-galacturonosidase [Leeuwenhoekiella sp.]MBA82583.1 exo-poly-alpha-D-galacturonosidase [Leeuwenhoekiella sp.]|tara:strand:+ start:206 stop:1696 length:1491 start_codon:yes stop_codon:yes gene_type:complete